MDSSTTAVSNSNPKPAKGSRKNQKKGLAKKRDDAHADGGDAGAAAGAAGEENVAPKTDRELAPHKPVQNGRASPADRDDADGDDNRGDGALEKQVEALQAELEKERTRSRELQALAKSSSDPSRSSATTAAATATEEELRKERDRSHDLERRVQALTEELSAASGPRAGKGSADTNGRVRELEEQVSQLRTELADEKAARAKDAEAAAQRTQQVEEEKQSLDSQYKNLLGRVSTIKSTLGEKMRADAEELANTRRMVDDLEEQNRQLEDTIDGLRGEIAELGTEKGRAAGELSSLRARLNLAQQNWTRERDDLVGAERFAREECEVARQTAQDWEVIATEERSVREQLSDRVVELEEQLSTQKSLHDHVAAEKDREASRAAGLQRALEDEHTQRRKELRETVESMQAQIDGLLAKCQAFEQRAKEAEAELHTAKQDLERVLPFEKEVREKNLLIGKLRHEAVTLNDHLRKALRMLKRGSAEDKIDKQLVTNVFLQFISIQRGDTKKYEVLQLIASVLDWTDEQREKAGLLRPGTASSNSGTFMSSARTPPLSPFHRSPSTPSLSDAYDGSKELWTSVLDSTAEKP